MRRRLKLVDEPGEWITCFGLDDNPFCPTMIRNGLQMDKFEIETKPLYPNLPGQEQLYSNYFVEEVDEFQLALSDFEEYMTQIGLHGLRQSPIMLIYGPRGSGKTTFSNICCYILIDSLSTSIKFFRCEVDIDDPQRGFLTLDEIIKSVSKQIALELGETTLGKSGDQDLEVIAKKRPELENSLVVIVLKHLTTGATGGEGFEPKAPFQFLSTVRQRLRKHLIPVIFATTSYTEVFKSLSNRPLGDDTETKRFQIGELSGEDVVKFITKRVNEFRSKDKNPPNDMPIFPFKEKIIIECFTDLQRKGVGKGGKLPFRNVNRILIGALRRKKQDLMMQGKSLEPYESSLRNSDISRRLIDKGCLDSAIKGHLS